MEDFFSIKQSSRFGFMLKQDKRMIQKMVGLGKSTRLTNDEKVLGYNPETARWEEATKDVTKEQDCVEAGLHLIECEKPYNEENHENYKCTKCTDSTEVVWGLQEKELCWLAKSAYEKITTFKANIRTVPANKTGKEFYELYAETLEWANQETKSHYGWHMNHILHPICLKKTPTKRHRKNKGLPS